jgi:general secretion pathway protein J
MSRREAEGGFTVLELLIVIAVFSLIVVMLSTGQQFATRAWHTQERQIDAQADVGAIQNALRQLLVAGRNFQGDDQSLQWIGPLPKALDRGGLFDITLSLDEGRLFLSWLPHFTGPKPKADPTTADLAKDVEEIKLSYYLPAATGAGNWAEGIKDKKPALIKIAMKLGQGRWPPLIIAPVLDPLTTPAAAPANGVPPAPGAPPQPQQQDNPGQSGSGTPNEG